MVQLGCCWIWDLKTHVLFFHDEPVTANRSEYNVAEMSIYGLTLPEERFLLESTGGGGSSSSLEKASRLAGMCRDVFWEVSSFRYSCTNTSLVGLPLGSSTLWASSSLFSLSLVSTDGSSRYSGMLSCGWRDNRPGKVI